MRKFCRVEMKKLVDFTSESFSNSCERNLLMYKVKIAVDFTTLASFYYECLTSYVHSSKRWNILIAIVISAGFRSR